MTYELVTLPTGEQILKGTEASGKVWWIPQDPGNIMYQAYLKTI